MKYYKREITVRDYQGSHKKAVFVPQTEYVKTNDISPFNKNKRVKFEESEDAKKFLRRKAKDTVIVETKQLSESEIHFRKPLRSRWRR